MRQEAGISTTTTRTRVRRLPERGRYDRATIEEILDEALFHVGFVHHGQPYVIPTIHARMDDRLVVHCSAASRMVMTASCGIEMCVTVTILDGLVLARSAFDHSMNYRSVLVFGRATPIADREEKLEALRRLSEHVVPGRWEDVRAPTLKELKATVVLSLPITEASAKVRSGPPCDAEQDYELPVWAGEIPLVLSALPPRPDPGLRFRLDPPRYAVSYGRPAAHAPDSRSDDGKGTTSVRDERRKELT